MFNVKAVYGGNIQKISRKFINTWHRFLSRRVPAQILCWFFFKIITFQEILSQLTLPRDYSTALNFSTQHDVQLIVSFFPIFNLKVILPKETRANKSYIHFYSRIIAHFLFIYQLIDSWFTHLSHFLVLLCHWIYFCTLVDYSITCSEFVYGFCIL